MISGLIKINVKFIILTVLVLVVSIVLQLFYNFESKNSDVTKTVLNIRELELFNGKDMENLYVAVMGRIFDVTPGSKHYGIGKSYNYFVGKDGTRALVTGNFKDESTDKDHVLDLSCDNLLSLLHWRSTFREKYNYIGVLSGRYYDEYGKETEYMRNFKQKINECKKEKEELKKQEEQYPPCNIAWSETDGTRVWCTKSSGGVIRSWVGVPRQKYSPGAVKPQCVCVNNHMVNDSLFKVYDNCDILSTQCFLHNH